MLTVYDHLGRTLAARVYTRQTDDHDAIRSILSDRHPNNLHIYIQPTYNPGYYYTVVIDQNRVHIPYAILIGEDSTY